MAYKFSYTLTAADGMIKEYQTPVPAEITALYNSYVSSGKILGDTYELDTENPLVSHHSITFATEADHNAYMAEISTGGWGVDNNYTMSNEVYTEV